MTTPEDFEQSLADRMERAGEAVTGEGVTLDGVTARHRERARARRVRQGAAAAVAAGVMAVVGVGVVLGAGGDGTTRIAAEGSGPEDPAPAAAGCGEGAAVIVYLRPSASEDESRAIGQVLEERFGPEAVRFTSRDEAYQQARELFADQSTVRDLLRPEDVPASFRIAVAGTGGEALAVQEEVQELVTGREVSAVESVHGDAVVAPTVPAGEVPSTTTTVGTGNALTDEQYDAIVDYIRTIQVEDEPSQDGCDEDDAAATTSPPSTGTTSSPAPSPSPDPTPESTTTVTAAPAPSTSSPDAALESTTTVTTAPSPSPSPAG